MDWLRYKMIFLPIFYVSGKRYRIRVRLIGWRGFHKRKEVFEEDKTVIRIWLGFLLVTAMVDIAKG
jgi:hypothetical protein